MSKYAVIDLGSLKAKLLVGQVEKNSIDILSKKSTLTLLGDGLKEDEHKVKEKSLNKTIKAVQEYKSLCKETGTDKVKLVATESLRNAKNLEEVINRFKRETNLKPEIISQDEEAKVYFQAVSKDINKDEEFALVDMGGGSVQVMVGKKGEIQSMHLMPLGSYRLVQKFISNRSEDGKATPKELQQIKQYIKAEIKKTKLPIKKGIPLIYGSSNVLDLINVIKIQKSKHDLSKSHPYYIKPGQLTAFLERIEHLTHIEREEKYPFQYGYMWGIQIAFLNAFYIAKALNTEVILPSNVNIAEGYLLEMAHL